MAIEIKPETIKEIAEYLDMGMVCFYHKITGEIESYPDESNNTGVDDKVWVDIIDKIEQNADDYIRLEAMPGYKAFKIIEVFIDDISDLTIREKFIDAISRKRPFSRFNELLHYYPDLREQWFIYKLEAYIEYVKEQLPQG